MPRVRLFQNSIKPLRRVIFKLKLTRNLKKDFTLKKTITAICVAALVTLGISGCSSLTPEQQMFETLKVTCPVDEKDKVSTTDVEKAKVSTDLGKAPTVEFLTPLDSTVSKIQTTVVVEGKGPKFTGGQFVTWEYTVFDGASKNQISATPYDGTDSQQMMIPAQGELCTSLAGVREGSRVALLVPSSIAGAASGCTDEAKDDAGNCPPASQLWVFDIKKIFLPKAVGDEKPAANGMPTVTRDTNGVPSVTIPKGSAPTEFSASAVIEGKGTVVKKGQSVLLHYSGYLWSDGSKFDSSWDGDNGGIGQPMAAELDEAHFIPGFVKAVVGAKVGSQIVTVIPADLAYGATGNGTIPANATLVFVIDVLGIIK